MLTKSIIVLSLSANRDIPGGLSEATELQGQDATRSQLSYPLSIAKLQRRSFLFSLGIHIVIIVLLRLVGSSGYAPGKMEVQTRPPVVTTLYFKPKSIPKLPTDNISDRSFRGVNSRPTRVKPRFHASASSTDRTPKVSQELPVQPHLDTFPGRALVAPASAAPTTPRLPTPAGFTDVSLSGTVVGESGRRVLLGSFSSTKGSLGGANTSERSGDEVRSAGFPSERTPSLQISNQRLVSSIAPTFEKAKIIDMPKPEYTDVARKLGIQGVVRVAVVFKADGNVLVTGIANSLGFGLDENAVAAVLRIRFQPARRDGKENVDQSGMVEAVFQLSHRGF